MTSAAKTALALAGSMAAAVLVLCVTPGPGETSRREVMAKQDATTVAPVATPTDSALAEALETADPDRRATLLEAWAQAVDVKDAPGVLEQIGATAGLTPALKQEARGALLKSWCGRDLQSAAAWFGRRGGADALQEQAPDTVASSLAGSEPAARLAWMQQVLPASAQRELLGPFFRQWTTSDPAAAAGQLRQLAEAHAGAGDDPPWRDLLGEVAAQWAGADLNRAVGWAEALPNGANKSAALQRIAPHWTQVAPQAAAAYAANAGDPALLAAIAGQWAGNDPARAAAWASSLPAGPGRDGAITRAATMWAENDPVQAATYVAQLPAGEGRGAAAVAVVSIWATTAPAEAAQWAGQFPEGAVRQRALAALLNTWAASDAAGASAFLQALPAGASRDSAIDAFGGAIYTSLPAEAFRWEQAIAQPPLREQELVRTARYWLQQDPARAKTEIAQSNLPPEMKAELLADKD